MYNFTSNQKVLIISNRLCSEWVDFDATTKQIRITTKITENFWLEMNVLKPIKNNEIVEGVLHKINYISVVASKRTNSTFSLQWFMQIANITLFIHNKYSILVSSFFILATVNSESLSHVSLSFAISLKFLTVFDKTSSTTWTNASISGVFSFL